LANLNADNSVGTVQSIEDTLRALDRMAEKERERAGRRQKSCRLSGPGAARSNMKCTSGSCSRTNPKSTPQLAFLLKAM
jgi:hypothetical protein